MTSDLLRKLLVAGAAVAALSVAACSKPADTSNTASTDNSAAAPVDATANATPMAAATDGLPPECDAYLNKAQACFDKAGGSPMAGQMKAALDSTRKQWAAMSDKTQLAAACKAADAAFTNQAAMMHCS